MIRHTVLDLFPESCPIPVNLEENIQFSCGQWFNPARKSNKYKTKKKLKNYKTTKKIKKTHKTTKKMFEDVCEADPFVSISSENSLKKDLLGTKLKKCFHSQTNQKRSTNPCYHPDLLDLNEKIFIILKFLVVCNIYLPTKVCDKIIWYVEDTYLGVQFTYKNIWFTLLPILYIFTSKKETACKNLPDKFEFTFMCYIIKKAL